MTIPLKTPQAAAELGCTYFRLMSILRSGRIDVPAKDFSGDYLWTPRDLRRARAALTNGKSRPRRTVVGSVGT